MKPMKVMRLVLLVLGGAMAGCQPQTTNTSVLVLDSSGAPVAGAEVFLAKKNEVAKATLQGSTDAAGRFVFSPGLSSGDQLFARRRVYEHPSYRPDHGPGAGWVEHVYQTSRVVNDGGSVTDLTVTNPIGTQTLTVSPANVLIGWHLVVSLDWDASDDELDQLRTRFVDASQYLYNLTDGQFFIEQVEVADDAQLWGSAEIAFQVDAWVQPHSNSIGGFLGSVGSPAGSHIYMAPFSGNEFGSMLPATIIHELGHLALGLQDEYMGVNAFAQNYCTAARKGGPAGGVFSAGGARAACAMDSQFVSSKLCSGHNDSAHRSGNWQPGPCWNTVAAGYRDPRPGVASRDSWVVRTPDVRGAVVGTLPNLPVGLRPQISVTNRPHQELCKPFTFTDPAGASAAGQTVWVRPKSWGGDFTAGRLDNNSQLMVRGVHLGDSIWAQSPVATVVDKTMCTVTQ